MKQKIKRNTPSDLPVRGYMSDISPITATCPTTITSIEAKQPCQHLQDRLGLQQERSVEMRFICLFDGCLTQINNHTW